MTAPITMTLDPVTIAVDNAAALPKVLIARETINARLDELAKDINAAYANQQQPLVVLCVLKGAFMFCADLMKRLNIDCQIEFIRLQSYGELRHSSGTINIKDDIDAVLPDLTNRDVLVVEDIIDTGLTLEVFIKALKEHYQPNSIKLAVLLDKSEMRSHHVPVDFVGFEIPNQFVVGYGLDDNELSRNLPYIGVVE